MAKYLVKERSFIGNSIVEPGTVIDYDGDTHPNLEAADKAAEKAKTERTTQEINAADAVRRANAAQAGASLDPDGRALDADGDPLPLGADGKPVEASTLV